jgi:hypothetical protein
MGFPDSDSSWLARRTGPPRGSLARPDLPSPRRRSEVAAKGRALWLTPPSLRRRSEAWPKGTKVSAVSVSEMRCATGTP